MIKILINLDIPICWTAPSGMIIEQKYIGVKKNETSICINYKRRKFVLRISTEKIAKIKSINAIAPNIIHSMDASYLMKIINILKKSNKNILSIHDCFIIHPNDTQLLISTLITEFILMYTSSKFINEFHRQCLDQISLRYEIDDKYIYINDEQIEIPENPFKENREFYINMENANYMLL